MASAAELTRTIIASLDEKMAKLYPRAAAGLREYHAALAVAIADAIVSHESDKPPKKERP